MTMQKIERQFTRIGARAKVHPPVVRRWVTTPEVSIDIGNDAEGEFFDIAVQSSLLAETQVLDVQPSLRHLLLMSRQDDGKPHLCEEVVRQGGQLVYVSNQHPNGLTEGRRSVTTQSSTACWEYILTMRTLRYRAFGRPEAA